jgi:hypothetical protein
VASLAYTALTSLSPSRDDGVDILEIHEIIKSDEPLVIKVSKPAF